MNNVVTLIDLLFNKFEAFILRAILPSSVFIILMVFVDSISKNLIFTEDNINFLNDQSSSLLIVVFIIFLLTLSYILKFLSQLIFDNFIKTDYDPSILKFYKKENDGFALLRSKVLEKLQSKYNFDTSKIETNDYVLYQIIGRLIKIDTKRYTTDAKEVGIIIVSVMIALGWYIYLSHIYWLVLIMMFLWYLGLTYEKIKYRSRAYRMYVNFLFDTNN